MQQEINKILGTHSMLENALENYSKQKTHAIFFNYNQVFV